jgi:uncharacterized protein (TIGR03435 family)
MRYVCLLAALAPILTAEQPAPSPSRGAPQFEVASIRPAAPLDATSKVGLQTDGQQFRAAGFALRDYLSMAHALRIYQIEGPEWIASQRFDITAKLPAEYASKKPDGKELNAMMAQLLDERFQIKSHTVKKEVPVYVLVQTKGGIRAIASPLDPESSTVTVASGASSQGTTVALPRGSSVSVGANRIEAKKYSMLALADTLARLVDRPVINQTGLNEEQTYDFSIEMTPEDFQIAMIRGAVAAGITLPPEAMRLLDNPPGDSLYLALEKLGLQLEPKKEPLDVLVIDSASRTPTDN